MTSNQIIIFASGSGSNAENIVNYFSNKRSNHKWLICTNNPKARVIERAKKLQIDYKIFTKDELYNGSILNCINSLNPELIILAGFLLKFPIEIINVYNKKIINIHPALLPKYGGKGMYGMNVHKAIIKNKEVISGITIHYVNKKYDEGPIIFQKEIKINPSYTPNDLANKIHDLEMEYFPKIVENLLTL
jgi:phosphoribosylglycinamide formyltransferase-1|tara:strand:+ start:66 stop:635 length:570 start_codon:yes stop_codon:yes gene_type:complete